MSARLTLKEAIKKGRLDDFIAQAEAEGVEAADREQFDGAVATVIRTRRSTDQTSGSSRHDGSREK